MKHHVDMLCFISRFTLNGFEDRTLVSLSIDYVEALHRVLQTEGLEWLRTRLAIEWNAWIAQHNLLSPFNFSVHQANYERPQKN